MARTFRARVTRGVLKPLDRIDLPEGTEVTVTIREVPSRPDVEAFRRAAGRWRGAVDADALIRAIYASRRIATRRVPRL